MNDDLTVRQAAEKLDVTPARVRQLILAGDIKARRLTPRMLMIAAKELAKYKRPKMGRPPKNGKKARK